MKALKRINGEETKKKLKPTYLPECPVDTELPDPNFSVSCAFIGDSSVGKSTLLSAIAEKVDNSDNESLFDRYYAQVTSRKGETLHITYCECSAAEEHSRVRSLTYQINQIFFVCFSTVNRSSFEHAMLEWYPELDIIVPDAPIYLIGMQSDLRDQILESGSNTLKKTIVTQEEAQELLQQIGGIQYLETKMNDSQMMIKIVKQIAEAMLIQVENQPTKKISWRKQLLGKNNVCMSPKEMHQREINRSRKKESVMVLSPSRVKPKKSLAKITIRKSTLPNECGDDIQDTHQDENKSQNLPEIKAAGKEQETFVKVENNQAAFSLKKLRKRLFKISKKKPVATLPEPAKIKVDKWEVKHTDGPIEIPLEYSNRRPTGAPVQIGPAVATPQFFSSLDELFDSPKPATPKYIGTPDAYRNSPGLDGFLGKDGTPKRRLPPVTSTLSQLSVVSELDDTYDESNDEDDDDESVLFN